MRKHEREGKERGVNPLLFDVENLLFYVLECGVFKKFVVYNVNKK